MHLGSYLIDSNRYVDHYLKRNTGFQDDYQKYAKDHNIVVCDVDITPYAFILENSDTEITKMFYLYFNNYIHTFDITTKQIDSYDDIDCMLVMLCFIFYIQYFFL
jgi:hypothetical protein